MFNEDVFKFEIIKGCERDDCAQQPVSGKITET